jgi:HAD superfamily hydrolase (TIGR01450 family)
VTGAAAGYDLVIFDLDGVVYLGTEPVAGAAAGIAALRLTGVPVAFATNNASRRGTEVVDLLKRVGVPSTSDEVITSAEAAARLLAESHPAGAAVLVLGAPALGAELAAVGLTPVTQAADQPVAVVQGFSPALGWADLAEAHVAIRAGASWVATNVDATWPSPRGPLPGNGSLVAALATALGRGPDIIVGKPEPALFRTAADRLGAEHALVVGDRLDTDIEGANRAGMDSLLVLTGVTQPIDLVRAEPSLRPTHVAADLSGLDQLADGSRVPAWDFVRGEARAAKWTVTSDGDRLILDGDGQPVDALRAVAAAMWAHPGRGVVGVGQSAAVALTTLGLASGQDEVRAVSATSRGHRSPPSPTPGQPPRPRRN